MSYEYVESPEDDATDQAEAPAPFSFETGRSSSPRWLLIGAIAAVVVVAAGVFGVWRLIVTSPEYSLGKAREAIEAGDTEQVAVYVDTELIAEDLVDGSVVTLSEDLGSPLATTALEGLADLTRPLVTGVVSKQVMERVMSLDETTDTPLTALSGTCDIKRDGDLASATFTGEDGAVLVLKMAYTGEHWRVVGLGNAAEVAEVVMPDLSGVLEEYMGEFMLP